MKNTQPLFTLYTHPLSANGRKVLALTYHLNLDADIRADVRLVNVYQGEGQHPDYLKINPLGQIPALVDNATGKLFLESNFILMHIAEHYDDSHLFSVAKKHAIMQWLFWESSQWQPACSSVLRDIVAHKLLPTYFPAPTGEPNWNDAAFSRALTYLNNQLTQQPFLAGADLSIADFSVAGMLTYFRFAKFPFANYIALHDWYERIEALKAWQSSSSDLWSDSE